MTSFSVNLLCTLHPSQIFIKTLPSPRANPSKRLTFQLRDKIFTLRLRCVNITSPNKGELRCTFSIRTYQLRSLALTKFPISHRCEFVHAPCNIKSIIVIECHGGTSCVKVFRVNCNNSGRKWSHRSQWKLHRTS